MFSFIFPFCVFCFSYFIFHSFYSEADDSIYDLYFVQSVCVLLSIYFLLLCLVYFFLLLKTEHSQLFWNVVQRLFIYARTLVLYTHQESDCKYFTYYTECFYFVFFTARLFDTLTHTTDFFLIFYRFTITHIHTTTTDTHKFDFDRKILILNFMTFLNLDIVQFSI